ncbi:outer membrane protein assembly factor BamC [Wenzhouxiangella marina]|uniref:Uncharacterized protein n=1 Tax=Wenzhouxiangella marina TaxID=1579979 RepID=A0A0K0XUA3_9GAMM|nr:outer membrane protein assembly factor BamC [Wenzhouxiangella marina]AKS41294.1 hypothetical protein WM2015_913 [Wenzhouxiangella marina]MBB6086956.1 putative lipoprotein [Wenzhouxiangella marina]
MNFYRLCSIALVASLMAGCFNRDRQPIYVQSEEVPPIEVPEDLSLPDVRQTYDIPGTYLPQLAAMGNEARPPVVLSSAEAEASRSHIRFGPTGLYLEVEDEASSVWRRLSFTLNRGGMSVRQVNEDAMRYRFDFRHDPVEIERSGMSRLAFWRSGEILDYSGAYQAELQPDGANTRVVLLGGDGEILDMDRAEFVLAVLRERLG